MPRAKQRTPELRDQVLRAAVAMLADDGVAGFTTRRVAAGRPDLGAGGLRAVRRQGRAGPGDLLRGLPAAAARRFDTVAETDDPRADLLALVEAFRVFVRDNPVLAQVMFSRPFADFDPGPDELRAAGLGPGDDRRVRCGACIAAGVIAGDATDIAHVLLALAQGLSAQETAGWLGSSPASMDRRWALALRTLLDGLARASHPLWHVIGLRRLLYKGLPRLRFSSTRCRCRVV